MTRTAHKKIFVANVDKIDDAQYDHMMQVLQTVEDKNDERAVEAIAEIVPTYHRMKKNRPDNKGGASAKKTKIRLPVKPCPSSTCCRGGGFYCGQGRAQRGDCRAKRH